MPARCTLMVLGKTPVPAVGWDTKQEIDAEVWLGKRAAEIVRSMTAMGR